MKKTKENKAITLVALVVTVIILLILAGISIASLTGNGLFEKAKLAKEKQANAEIKEETTLSEYENKINDYVSSTRNGTSKIQSLINKDDGIYDKANNGYIYNTATNDITYTANNIIALKDSIENYDYIVFEFDNYYIGVYSYACTNMFSVDKIKQSYNNTDKFDSSKTNFIIYNSGGNGWNRIALWFKNSSTIEFQYGRSGTSDFSKIRVTDIKGVKY